MKAHITPSGFLHIERSGKMKPQICPMNNNKQMCGDWCPMFGEPKWEEVTRITSKSTSETLLTADAIIQLCHGKKIYAEPLIDERPIREEVK